MDWEKSRAFIWPDVKDERSARDAAKLGWFGALFMAGITLFSIVIGNLPSLNYVDVVLSCLIGYGCLNMFRVAAISGLILVIAEMLYKYNAHGTFGMMPLFALYYANAIRGTFYFAKMKNTNLAKQ